MPLETTHLRAPLQTNPNSLASTPPAANGGPLERSISLQSGSTAVSDSTAASSRRATLGSSMPRSDYGSLAGEVMLEEHREAAEAAAPAAPAAAAAPRGGGGRQHGGSKPDVRERPRGSRGAAAAPAAQQQEREQQAPTGKGRQAAAAPQAAQLQPLGGAAGARGQPPARGATAQQFTPSAQQQLGLERPPELAGAGPALQEPAVPTPLSPTHGGPPKILRREPQPAAAQQMRPAQQAIPAAQQPQQPQQQQSAMQAAPPAVVDAEARMAHISLGPPGPAAAQTQQQQQQPVAEGWAAPQGRPLGAGWQPGQAGGSRPQEEGSRSTEDVVQLGGGFSLPSQETLMHHIASPERQPMLRPAPPQLQAGAPGAAGLARSMLPALPPQPPVSVTAHFGPPGQQQQQQHMPMSIAGLTAQPGAPLMYALPGGQVQAGSQPAAAAQRGPYGPGSYLLPQAQGVGGAVHPGLLGLTPQQQQQQGGLHSQLAASVAAGPGPAGSAPAPQPLYTFGSMPQVPSVGEGLCTSRGGV